MRFCERDVLLKVGFAFAVLSLIFFFETEDHDPEDHYQEIMIQQCGFLLFKMKIEKLHLSITVIRMLSLLSHTPFIFFNHMGIWNFYGMPLPRKDSNGKYEEILKVVGMLMEM